MYIWDICIYMEYIYIYGICIIQMFGSVFLDGRLPIYSQRFFIWSRNEFTPSQQDIYAGNLMYQHSKT